MCLLQTLYSVKMMTDFYELNYFGSKIAWHVWSPSFFPCLTLVLKLLNKVVTSYYTSLTFLVFCCSLGSHHSFSLSVLGIKQTPGYYGLNDMSTLTGFHCIVIHVAHQTTKLIVFNKSTSLVYILRSQKNSVRKLSWPWLWFYWKCDCFIFLRRHRSFSFIFFFSRVQFRMFDWNSVYKYFISIVYKWNGSDISTPFAGK